MGALGLHIQRASDPRAPCPTVVVSRGKRPPAPATWPLLCSVASPCFFLLSRVPGASDSNWLWWCQTGRAAKRGWVPSVTYPPRFWLTRSLGRLVVIGQNSSVPNPHTVPCDSSMGVGFFTNVCEVHSTDSSE